MWEKPLPTPYQSDAIKANILDKWYFDSGQMPYTGFAFSEPHHFAPNPIIVLVDEKIVNIETA